MGQDARHNTHSSISTPSIITVLLELHSASVYGPAITGKKEFPSRNTLIRDLFGLKTFSICCKEQTNSQS